MIVKKRINGTNELTDKTERDSQTWRMNVRFLEGKGQLGSLGWTCTHCYIQMDKQQGPAVQHRELCSVPRGSGESGYMCTDG